MPVEPKRASEWTIHGERVVDDTRRAVLSIADVELEPNWEPAPEGWQWWVPIWE